VARLALGTSFLIDLQNEHGRRGASTGAIAFLEAHAATELLLPSVALGEYLEGFADPAARTHGRWSRRCESSKQTPTLRESMPRSRACFGRRAL
jgi:hypothetical protein